MFSGSLLTSTFRRWQVKYARKLARYAPALLPPAPQPRGFPEAGPSIQPRGGPVSPAVPSGEQSIPSGENSGDNASVEREKSIPAGEKASSLPSGEKAPMWARALLWVVDKYIFRKMRRCMFAWEGYSG